MKPFSICGDAIKIDYLSGRHLVAKITASKVVVSYSFWLSLKTGHLFQGTIIIPCTSRRPYELYTPKVFHSDTFYNPCDISVRVYIKRVTRVINKYMDIDFYNTVDAESKNETFNNVTLIDNGIIY